MPLSVRSSPTYHTSETETAGAMGFVPSSRDSAFADFFPAMFAVVYVADVAVGRRQCIERVFPISDDQLLRDEIAHRCDLDRKER